MDGNLPEIFWYIFWVGFVILGNIGMYFGFTMTHRQRMKALEILKMYAEKGAEPPPAVTEQLAKQILAETPDSPKRDSRAALIQGFTGFLFMACVAGGLVMWLPETAEPSWLSAIARAAMAFFGFGSFGFLVLALLTRDK